MKLQKSVSLLHSSLILLSIFVLLGGVVLANTSTYKGKENVSINAGKKIAWGLEEKIKSAGIDEEIPIIVFYKSEKKSKAKTQEVVASAAKVHGGKVKHKYNLVNAISAKIPAGRIKKFAETPEVERVYYDASVYALPVEVQNFSANLYTSTIAIGANYTWNTLGYTGKNITVAVLDTGIYYDHSDLGGGFGTGYKVKGGYNFVNNSENPIDRYGHGTHVAGIIAANGTIKGVAPDASLLAVKVLNDNGLGDSSDILAGVDWAVGNGANIISMSLGNAVIPYYAKSPNDEFVSPLTIVADAAVDRGVVVVVAAGNVGPGTGTVTAPACAKKVITVGASDDHGTSAISDDTVADLSGMGPSAFGRLDPEVVAPGMDIYSTYPATIHPYTGYDTMSGTSMAAPHVSGAVALMLQKNSTLKPAEIRSILMHTSSGLSGAHVFNQGTGIINITRALITNTAATINGDDRWEVSVLPDFSATTELFLKNDCNAGSVGYTFAIDQLTDLEGNNSISTSNFILPEYTVVSPGGNESVSVGFQAPADAKPSIYGTTLVISGNNSETLRVPIAITIPLLESGKIQGTVDDDYNGTADEVGDVVYYKLNSHNGTSMTADLTWSSDENDLDLYLFAPNGVLQKDSAIDNADWGVAAESISLEDMLYSEYWIAVHNWNSNNAKISYTLNIGYSSGLMITPSLWQGGAKKGEIKNITFKIKNNASAKNLTLSVNRIKAGDSNSSSGTVAGSGEVVWNSTTSGVNTKYTKYINATLQWNDYTRDLNMTVVYPHYGTWIDTRFSSGNNNTLLQDAKESLENVDVQYYIKKYGSFGIRIRNNATVAQAYNLTVNLTDLAPWEDANIGQANLSINSNSEVEVNVSVNTSNLTFGKTYDLVFEIEEDNDDLATVPVRLSISGAHNSDTGTYYSNLTDAIADANAGATIFVALGEYEENLDINAGIKLISLQGAPSTVINPSGSDHIIKVNASDVEISGFTIKGATSHAGIYINGSNNSKISNCNITNNFYGILLNGTSGGSFSQNNLLNTAWDFYFTGNSTNNTVVDTYINKTKVSFTGFEIGVVSSSNPSNASNLLSMNKYLNISNTSSGGWTFMNISYTSSDLGRITESTLRIYRYNGTEWGNVSGSDVNAGENHVYANITNFSIFSPMGIDITPPTITDVQATSISSSSATITWNTDEESDSVVKYGTQSGNYVSNVSNTSNVTSHSMQLSGLSAGTTYYYIINSTDLSGNANKSIEYYFTTSTQTSSGGGGGGGAVPKPKIILLANSIDYNLSDDFIAFLNIHGIEVKYVALKDFSFYKKENYIVILGGPEAYEGVGNITKEVLNESEEEYLRIRGNHRMYVKNNVWKTGQAVMVIAGSDRWQTRSAVDDNRVAVMTAVQS